MLSIITITYNNLNGLQKTANSIQTQTSQDFEWIIIDGNSNDGTKDYLETLNANITSEPDEGIYDAMNKGLQKATKDYIIFMNAGDQFADKQTLFLLQEDITKHDEPDFIHGPALEERANNEPILKSSYKTKFLFWGMPSHHQSMLYKCQLIENNRYNTNYKIAADYDFTCRFLRRAKTVHQTTYPICLFEAGGVSQQAVKQGRTEQLDIRHNLKIVNPVFNHIIYGLQAVVMQLRQKCPQLYWLLRGQQTHKK